MWDYEIVDRFHHFFPDADEPKLPIEIYDALLDKVDEETAFELLCNYESGFATLDQIKMNLTLSDPIY